jgi:hypothetical protein
VHECKDRGDIFLGGEYGAEGKARSFDADDEVYMGNTVGGADKEKVGYGLGDVAVRAEGAGASLK